MNALGDQCGGLEDIYIQNRVMTLHDGIGRSVLLRLRKVID